MCILYELSSLLFVCVAWHNVCWVPRQAGEGAVLPPAGEGGAMAGGEGRETEREGDRGWRQAEEGKRGD